MIVELSNELRIIDASFSEKRKIKEDLSLINPLWKDAVRFGRRTYGIQKVIKQYRCKDKNIYVPRGYLDTLVKTFGPPRELVDKTISFPKVSIPSKIELRPLQKPWIESALKHNQGICVAAAAFGKTVASLEMISTLGQPALWLVDQVNLAEQFINRANEFLDVGKVGMIGAGKESIGDILTTGIIQTLTKRDLSDIVNIFGAVFYDESHGVPAQTCLKVISQFPSNRLYGITATPYREDSLEILMYNAIGPVITYVDRDELVEAGLILPARVKVCNTGVTYHKWNADFSEIIEFLSVHEGRNRRIAMDILSEIALGNTCIALTSRIEHGKILRQKLLDLGVDCEHIHSKQYKKLQDKKLKRFLDGEVPLIIATYRLLSKGFDHPKTNRIFFTLPYKAESTIEQAKGRIERIAPGKVDACLYDYADSIKMLKNQLKIRMLKYEEHNLEISYH